MRPALSLIALLLNLLPALASPQGLRHLTPEEARLWENPTALTVSADGKWAAITVRRVEGDGKLVVKSLEDSSEWSASRATDPVFGPDNRWIAYKVMPPYEKTVQLKDQGKPLPMGMGFRALVGGKEKTLENVTVFRFLGGGKTLMALGGDRQLHLFDLDQDDSTDLDDVDQAVPNPDGTFVAVATGGDDSRQLAIVDATGEEKRTLAVPGTDLKNLVWSTDGGTLAFEVATKVEGMEGAYNRLVVARDVCGDEPKIAILDPAKRTDFPKGYRIVETAPLAVSDDGRRVSFGIRPWERSTKDDGSTVEIWNAGDTTTAPERRVEKDRRDKAGLLSVWDLEGDRILQIQDSFAQEAHVLPGLRYAYLTDDRPYLDAAHRNDLYWDVESVRLSNGHRSQAFAKVDNPPVASRKGRYLAVFDDHDWWLYDLEKDTKANLTKALTARFSNDDGNFGRSDEEPEANAEWLADDRGLLLYDHYDAWLYKPDDASMARLTDGRASREIYRRVRLGDERDIGADVAEALYFRVLDENTKRSGYWSYEGGQGRTILEMKPVQLRLFERGGDRIVYSACSFEQPPTFYVLDGSRKDPQPLYASNGQQAQFAWGRSEVVDYSTKSGTRLHGVLIYPAGYDASKTYPMVMAVYERQSDDAFQYFLPNYQAPYNPQVFSQNGYFVLLPDIVFERKRQPGRSAVECAEAALDAVLAKKVGVDPTKVGVVGHSWGAYEAAYITTVSKRFAVGVCGGGLYDFASLSGSHYWRTGIPDSVIVQRMQGRMEVPIWDDPKAYADASPVWQAPQRTAPLLIEVGDKDDVVGFDQSVQLYNAMRQLGKNAVMLVYRDDGHTLQKSANYADYSRRVRHFLDVYLKGVPPEPWVSQPYKE